MFTALMDTKISKQGQMQQIQQAAVCITDLIRGRGSCFAMSLLLLVSVGGCGWEQDVQSGADSAVADSSAGAKGRGSSPSCNRL